MPKQVKEKEVDTKCYMNQKIFENLLRALVRGHQFFNQNQNPSAIVIKYPATVDGIPVIMEEQDATTK